DLVKRCLELPRILVHRELLHYRIDHHERQSVNEALFGDVLGFQQTGPCRICLRTQWPSCRCNRNCGHRGGTKEITLAQHLYLTKNAGRHTPIEDGIYQKSPGYSLPTILPLGSIAPSRSSASGTFRKCRSVRLG